MKRSLFAELRRRNVFRAGAFYLAAAWLLVQIATQVFPFYDLPSWAVRWVIGALAWIHPDQAKAGRAIGVPLNQDALRVLGERL